MTALRCVGCDKELDLMGRRHPRVSLPCCGERECKNVMKRRWNKERSVFALGRARERKVLAACDEYLAEPSAGALAYFASQVEAARSQYEQAVADLQP